MHAKLLNLLVLSYFICNHFAKIALPRLLPSGKVASSCFPIYSSRRISTSAKMLAMTVPTPSKALCVTEDGQKPVTWLAPSWHSVASAGNSSLGERDIGKASTATQYGFSSPVGINKLPSHEEEEQPIPSTDPEKPSPCSTEEAAQGRRSPPYDGGRQAWAFLIGAAAIEGLMWGRYLHLFF